MSRPRRSQKGKNRKRPRGWHRGPSAFRKQAKPLAAVEAAEARAVVIDEELAVGREDIRAQGELWRALRHVSPFAPSWDF